MTRSIARFSLFLTLGLLLALAAAVPAGAARGQKIPHTCSPKGSKTFKDSKYVRVFRAGREYRRKWRGKRVVESSSAYFSCDRNTKRWVFLFDDADGDANPPSKVEIAGHWLILLGSYTCSEDCDAPLTVFAATNTLTGRTIDLRTWAGTLPSDYKSFSYVEVGRFFITSKGVAAFAIRQHYRLTDGTDRTRTDIVEKTLAGDSIGVGLLDSGDGIDINSLALNGTTLTWTRDGAPKSSAL